MDIRLVNYHLINSIISRGNHVLDKLYNTEDETFINDLLKVLDTPVFGKGMLGQIKVADTIVGGDEEETEEEETEEDYSFILTEE